MTYLEDLCVPIRLSHAVGVDDQAVGVGADRGEAGLPMRFRTRGGPELLVRARLEGRWLVGTGMAAAWLGGQGRLVFEGRWEGT